MLSRLSTFFGYAITKKIITANPCDEIESITVDDRTPKILTLAQAQGIMRAAPKDTIGYLTLALFAGIRPDEVRRLHWSQVDFDRALVRVKPEGSKVREGRIVPLTPNAIAWLRIAQATNPDALCPSKMTLRRRIRSLRDSLKIDWQSDILRHTAASMHLAIHEDPYKVAYRMGTSPKILLKHYRDLVTQDVAEAFFKVTPIALDTATATG